MMQTLHHTVVSCTGMLLTPPPPPPPTHLQLAVHYFLIGAPAHTHEPVLGLHRCIMTYGGTPQMFKGGSP